MTIFAIGDVQGCYDPLRRLLAAVNFDVEFDHLWFVGDLVNRGAQSLEVLRFARGLGERAICVLGNHDLHLLAVAFGARSVQRNDTFGDVLDAPDREDLIEWLRSRPLIHYDRTVGFAMVHAGIPPGWSLGHALEQGRDLESVLRSDDIGPFLRAMYGNHPSSWSESMSQSDRLRFTTNAFTRLRYCTSSGELELDTTGPPGTQPQGFEPWYAIAARVNRDTPIIFGHWAALDLPESDSRRYRVHHVDTGCVWGRELTALALPSLTRTCVSCASGTD